MKTTKSNHYIMKSNTLNWMNSLINLIKGHYPLLKKNLRFNTIKEQTRYSKKYRIIIRFMKFNSVSILNTAVDFCVFTILTFLSFNTLIAQVISYSCGMINCYFWNNNWTFACNKQIDSRRMIRFVPLYLSSLIISLIVLNLLNDSFKINVFVSKIVATGFIININFLGNRLWVFKE